MVEWFRCFFRIGAVLLESWVEWSCCFFKYVIESAKLQYAKLQYAKLQYAKLRRHDNGNYNAKLQRNHNANYAKLHRDWAGARHGLFIYFA
jgi:uncharacterized protein YjbI with pentapeptide repeats